jgi:anti-sigma B factor antagonist
MKFSIDKHEKYVLIKLNESKLNSLISPQLKSEFILTNTEGLRNIILDLSAVKYSDSSGLSSLLVGHRLCKNSDGSFIITGLNENINRLVTISQLENVLSMEEIERELKKEAR